MIPEPIFLEEEGAERVHVYVGEDSLLTIGNQCFTKNESIKIRDFINQWTKSS